MHAHTISAHALELLRDHGQDKSLSSFPVKEAIAEPFAVRRSIAGVDIWHDGSGKVLNMTMRDHDHYEIVIFRRGVWEDAFLQL